MCPHVAACRGCRIAYGGRMATTSEKKTPSRARKAAAPDQRGRGKYAAARAGFEQRAQAWLRDRPGRVVMLPEELFMLARVGVPCETCGELEYQLRSSIHTVWWQRVEGGHWAAGVQVQCHSPVEQ